MRRLALNGRVVWITGASSGIGEAVAYECARQGARLILTARRRTLLEVVAAHCVELGAPVARVLEADLGRLDDLPALAQQAWDLLGGIDVLYNNAGISQRGLALDTTREVLQRVMTLDYFSPVLLSQAVVPMMIRRGGGHVVATTSIAGRFGFPLRSAYSSAKHALYGYYETLQAETYEQGIRVNLVCPGRVQTEISRHALESDGTEHGRMDEGQAGGLAPSKAARTIVRAFCRGKREVLVGGGELLMVYIKRFVPSLCARLARRIRPT